MKSFLMIVLLFTFAVAAAAQDETQATVKAVHFKKLQQFLPSSAIDGFTRSKPIGSTNNMNGFSVSEASVKFVKSTDSMEYTITIKITDMASIANTMWLTMYQQMDYENETEDGYEKSVPIAPSYHGIEKAETGDSKSCSLQFPVTNRFLVELQYSGSDDVKLLHSLVGNMDLKGLAGLADGSK